MNDSKTQEKPRNLPFFTRGGMTQLLSEVFSRYKKDFVEILRKELGEQFARAKPGFVELLRRELAGQFAREKAELTEMLRAEMQRVLEAQQQAEFTEYRNVKYATQRLAVLDSAHFVLQHMIKVPSFIHPHGTLEHALSLAPKGGLALEFGVYSGSTLKIIAQARNGSGVYGFDSFEGLPEEWRSGFPAGAFAVDQLPQVEGAELVVGWFDDTLPKFLQEHGGIIDFLHVDCDLYSSSKTVLDLAGPWLRPGSIVMFDEFFNYPGWQEHEHKAWNEYVQRTGVRFKYEAYTFNNEQVALRILEI